MTLLLLLGITRSVGLGVRHVALYSLICRHGLTGIEARQRSLLAELTGVDDRFLSHARMNAIRFGVGDKKSM